MTLILARLLLAPAACGEHPQRLDAAKAPNYRSNTWSDQLRGRTLHQSEGERIYR